MPAGLLTGVIYSRATGRIRRIIDVGVETDASRLAAHPACQIGLGEAFHAHVSPGDGWNAESEIQSDLALKLGKHPLHLHPEVQTAVQEKLGALAPTVVHDRYVEIDATGKIIDVHYCDPACGDTGPNGGTLVLHDTADPRWTHSAGVFTAPVMATKSAGTIK